MELEAFTDRGVLVKILSHLDDYFDLTNVIYMCSQVYYTVITNDEIKQLIKSKLIIEAVNTPESFHFAFRNTGKFHGSYMGFFEEGGGTCLECNYINGLLDGVYTSYVMEGLPAPTIKSYYKLGKQDGVEEVRDPNGQLSRTTCWRDGKKQDVEKVYCMYTNRLQYLNRYKKDVLHGMQVEFYTQMSGEHVKTETIMINGCTQSVKNYNERGNLTYSTQYSVESGQKNGEYIEFYAPNEIVGWSDIHAENNCNKDKIPYRVRGQYTNGQKDGNWTYFTGSGHLDVIMLYKNDLLNGPFQEYRIHPETAGSYIYKITEYINHIVCGYVMEFNPFGDLVYKYHIGPGRNCQGSGFIKTGHQSEYHPNGTVAHLWNLDSQGRLDGTEIKCDPNKHIISSYRYRAGKKYGPFLENHPVQSSAAESVQVCKMGNYINDKLEGDYICYHPNGNIKVVANLTQGRLNGLYLKYHETGDIETVANYSDNRRIGVYTEWHPAQGGKKVRCVYTNEGEIDGVYYEWHPNGRLKTKLLYSNGTLELGEEKLTAWDAKGKIVKEISVDPFDGSVILVQNGKRTKYQDAEFFANLASFNATLLKF